MNSQKTILVTGASGGLGLDLVYSLSQRGFNVLKQYNNNADALRTLCGINVNSKHPEANITANAKFNNTCFQADLTNHADVICLRERIESRHGKLWGLINLAGASSNSMSWKLSPDEFTKIINVNLLSTFLTCKEFIPSFRDQGFGRIINVSSVVAYTGVPGAAHYCAAKAGVIGLTKSLALELAPKNVTVNALALGYCEKGIISQVPADVQQQIKAKTPLKRFANSEDVSSTVRFLLDENNNFMTGQVLHVNGGIYTV